LEAAVGSATTVRLLDAASAPKKSAAARVKDGAQEVEVLTSHPHGLVLAFDAIALKKLGTDLEAWHHIDLGGDVRPFRASRGIPLAEEAGV
jgi:hypothetical protein